MFSTFIFTYLTGNVTADATQSLTIIENEDKIKQLQVVDQHFDLSFGKMRMRLNKYIK